MASRAGPAEFVRRGIAGEVRRIFNDQARGEQPIEVSDDALIPRGSVAWRVHGDVTTMMIGGIAGLLLQMLHPLALAGVWDHSNFRRDMIGRLRRTARFIAVTTYGERGAAEAAIHRVRRIHEAVTGSLPDGTPYRAGDPHLLAWIHVAGSLSFLDAWIRLIEPAMTRADQDRYFAEVADGARRLGADPVPVTRSEADALLRAYLPELRADRRSREVRDIILRPKSSPAMIPIERLLTQSAISLLPPFARRLHGLSAAGLTRPALFASARGLARTLQWALRKA